MKRKLTYRGRAGLGRTAQKSCCHSAPVRIYRLLKDNVLTRAGSNVTTHFLFLAVWLQAHTRTQRGASLVEYALLVALIAVVCIAAVTTLGKSASSKFSTVGRSISG